MKRGDNVLIKPVLQMQARKLAGLRGRVIATGETWKGNNQTADIRLEDGRVVLDLWQMFIERGTK